MNLQVCNINGTWQESKWDGRKERLASCEGILACHAFRMHDVGKIRTSPGASILAYI